MLAENSAALAVPPGASPEQSEEKRKKLLAGHRNNGTCSSVPNGVSCRMKGSPSRTSSL